MERIRKLVQLSFQIDFHQVEYYPICQELAASVLHLKKLGLNTSTIARNLSVGYKTIERAVEWIEKFESWFVVVNTHQVPCVLHFSITPESYLN